MLRETRTMNEWAWLRNSPLDGFQCRMGKDWEIIWTENLIRGVGGRRDVNMFYEYRSRRLPGQDGGRLSSRGDGLLRMLHR